VIKRVYPIAFICLLAAPLLLAQGVVNLAIVAGQMSDASSCRHFRQQTSEYRAASSLPLGSWVAKRS
jgi:hypothetical protein